MTFLAHGIAGAGICSFMFWRSPKWLKWTVAIQGALFGMAPDVVDWIAHVFWGTPRWSIYSWMHNDPGWFIYHPAYCLHLVVDAVIHDPNNPGYNWWPDYFWLEILLWVFGIGLLWLTFRKR